MFKEYIDNIWIKMITFFFFYRGLPKLKKVKLFGTRLEKRTKIVNSADFISFKAISDELPELKGLIDEFRELLTNEGVNTQNCETVLSEENVFRAIDVDEKCFKNQIGKRI